MLYNAKRKDKTITERKRMPMRQANTKEVVDEKNRIISLADRIGSGVLLVLLTGFLMYAILVAIMYFI